MTQVKVNQSLTVTNPNGFMLQGRWVEMKDLEMTESTGRVDGWGKNMTITGVTWEGPDSNINPHCSCVFLTTAVEGCEPAEKGTGDFGGEYNLWGKVKVLELFRIKRCYTLALIDLFSPVNFHCYENYEINIKLLQFTECIAWTR